MSADLIDTTEMYLKTIYELEEDGITPLRARIVERLGHSGPTVSQTVGRMERDGLVVVMEDRRLELTAQGRTVARDVMRKHRLAERLLVDVVGMDWVDAHAEACRWEHVMSEKVVDHLPQLLGDPNTDPYGNPIPGFEPPKQQEETLPSYMESTPPNAARDPEAAQVVVARIGEPIQAEAGLLGALEEAGLLPGATATVRRQGDLFEVSGSSKDSSSVILDPVLATHFFVAAPEW